MEAIKTELLPCPFCGSGARLTNGYGNEGSSIQCFKYAEDCPVGPTVFEPAPAVPHMPDDPLSSCWLNFEASDAKAIERWNARTESARLADAEAERERIAERVEQLARMPLGEQQVELLRLYGELTSVVTVEALHPKQEEQDA